MPSHFEVFTRRVSQHRNVSLAIRRAAKRVGRPAVSTREIALELHDDPAITLRRGMLVSKALVRATRTSINDATGTRPRKHPRVHALGRVGNDRNYSTHELHAAAVATTPVLTAERDLRALRADRQLDAIDACDAASLAVGWARLLTAK